MARTFAMSSPETRNWTGKPTGGPFSSRETRPRSAGKSSVERGQQARAQPLALGIAPRQDHELREVRLLQLLVERQVEARAAGAHVRRRRSRYPAPRRGSLRASSLRRASRRKALPSASRRSTMSSGREDAGKNCCGTRRNSASDATNAATVTVMTMPAMRDAPVPPARGSGDRTASRRRRRGRRARAARGGGAALRRPVPGSSPPATAGAASPQVGQHPVAQVGNHDTATTHDAISAIADTSKIDRVYSPVLLLAVAIGRKPGDRDQRAGQHRERGARVGEARGAEAVEALLQLDRHHFDRDDRVVDQQAQRQDQRPERDLVQADAEQPHARERRSRAPAESTPRRPARCAGRGSAATPPARSAPPR